MLPVVVIGAGPVGLAAAAHLLERGSSPMVLEAGAEIAASMRSFGHVQLFTPWSYLIDPACQRLLERAGVWRAPMAQEVPRARDLVAHLDEVAASLSAHIHLRHKVIAITRQGCDRMKDEGRKSAPFVVVSDSPAGQRRILARAVIDASGTWTSPNPLGASGVPAEGEVAHKAHIQYGMPDIAAQRARYAGKRVVVVGAGHSAIGTLLALVRLAEEEPGTQVAWAVRGTDTDRLFGGGSRDQISARGALGTRIKEAAASGALTILAGVCVSALAPHGDGIAVIDQGRVVVVVDELVVATGSRPDREMWRELRLDLDPVTEAARALGPLIDPNHHSCGSVPPHGAKELAHPEEDFYVVGMKSYGRAPTFLLRTGFEQVRSVVAELCGDHEAARKVELVLPQTGVCSSDYGACC